MKNFHQKPAPDPRGRRPVPVVRVPNGYDSQTLQRGQIGTLNQTVYQQAAAIQSYTQFHPQLWTGKIARMDGRIAEWLKAAGVPKPMRSWWCTQKAGDQQIAGGQRGVIRRNRAIQTGRGHAGGEAEGGL